MASVSGRRHRCLLLLSFLLISSILKNNVKVISNVRTEHLEHIVNLIYPKSAHSLFEPNIERNTTYERK